MQESRYNVWVERGEEIYVYNGIGGALLRVPKEQYRSLRSLLDGQAGTGCQPKLLAYLAEGLMIVPRDSDELALLARRYQASQYDASLFALTIVTSLGCNFDCSYCFEAKHPSIMNEDVQQLVLHILDDQLPRIKSFRVTWYGGEPLVGKSPLLVLSDSFIERCDRAQVDYSADIVTNGYLLDEETCAQLRKRRISHAQVCLDGPPDVHDQMRPLAGGKGSFSGILQNLHHAIDYLSITIRMNVDTENFGHAEELLELLAAEGFAGKLTVCPGQIVGVNDGIPSPSATYKPHCFTGPEFAQAELQFRQLAIRYGFSGISLPRPTGAPCTAVRTNEFVVGSEGELYKCWSSIGNSLEVIGHIRDYQTPNGQLQKWLKYDPFIDAECRSCIALPVCMGGCAHHAMNPAQYENRCSTFRYTYLEQIQAFVETAELNDFTGSMPFGQLARPMETQ